jgi:hypothetical protein
MGDPILNLSAWIYRRRKEVGPYADHIIHSVEAYEARITALEDENQRLREAVAAADELARQMDEIEKESSRALEYGEEDPIRMLDWFDTEWIKSLERFRNARAALETRR